MGTADRKKDRIDYLDGCKVVLGALIVLAHYTIAFFPKGYIGFGGNYAPEEAEAAFLSGFPWSLFSNTSVTLYVLFGILSFLAAAGYYRAADREKFIRGQAVKRYFRFVIPVMAATILTYVLYHLGALRFQGMTDMTGAVWSVNIKGDLDDPSILKMLYSAFVGIFLNNEVEYLSVLWCMHIIFIGSMLSFGFLALFGQSRHRYWIYVVLALLSVCYPVYFVFLAGIVCGDMYSHRGREGGREPGKAAWDGWRREVSSMLLFLAGLALGMVPSVYVPEPLTVAYTYGVAVFFILGGILQSGLLKRVFSARIHRFGKYLFSLILVHMWVLFSVSYYVFDWLYGATGNYVLSFWLNYILGLGVSCALAVAYYYIFERTSDRLAGWIVSREDV